MIKANVNNALAEVDRDEAWEEQTSNDYFTIDVVKEWLLTTYPPNTNRRSLMNKLYAIKYRRNECPLMVYHRLNTAIDKAHLSIQTVNTYSPHSTPIKYLSNEDKYELFTYILYKKYREWLGQ